MNSISAADRAIDLCEAAKSMNLKLMGPYERAWSYVSEQLPKPEPEDYDTMVARERFHSLNEDQLCNLETRVRKSFAKTIKPRQQAVNQTRRWFRALWIGAVGYLLTSALRKTFNPLAELKDDTLGRVVLGTAAPFSCLFLFYGLLKCFQHPQQVAKSEKILNKTLAMRELIDDDLKDILREKVSFKPKLLAHQIEDQSPESEKSDEIE